MPYLVFSQQSLASLDVGQLTRNARRFFGAEFELRERGEKGGGSEVVMTIAGANGTPGPPVHARVRPCEGGDYDAAERAERAGRAGGMAGLARRCPYVWEVDVGAGAQVGALRLCSILASVLLGPIMPPEGDTLFGVKGARERAERLERSCILR
ncbi:MAG TPA: hypothetical protein VFS43_29350 [Polyangiaceae bacterium]|nr:hypothetical protein [Polyangiaceae bacterium]